MGIVALVLGVVTLLIANRWRKKVVFALLGVLWAAGLGAYVYASYGAQRAMAAAERRTTRAVIEVQGQVGESWGVTRTVAVRTPGELASLFEGLKLERNAVGMTSACGCTGNPHIQLCDAEGRFATVTVHHGRMVRGTLWSCGNVDLRAEAAAKLRAFMDSKGVELED